MRSAVLGSYRSLEDSLCKLLQNRQENNPLSPVAIVTENVSLKQYLQKHVAKEINNIAGIQFFDLLEFAKENFQENNKEKKFLPRHFQKILLEDLLPNITITSYLSNIPNINSIVNVTLNSIIFLKKMCISPLSFSELSKDNKKWCDISVVYTAYQEQLQHWKLADTEDLFSGDINYGRLFSCLCFYGFYDHTPIKQLFLSSFFKHPQIFSYIPFRQHPHYQYIKKTIDWYYESGFDIYQESSVQRDNTIVWNLLDKAKDAITVYSFFNEIDEMATLASLSEVGTALLLPSHSVYSNGMKNSLAEKNVPFLQIEQRVGSFPQVDLAIALLHVFEEEYTQESLQSLVRKIDFDKEKMKNIGIEINWEFYTSKDRNFSSHPFEIYLREQQQKIEQTSDYILFIRAFCRILLEISTTTEIHPIFSQFVGLAFMEKSFSSLQRLLLATLEVLCPLEINNTIVVGNWENLIGANYSQLFIPGATSHYFDNLKSFPSLFSDEEQRYFYPSLISKKDKEQLLLSLLFDSTQKVSFSYPKWSFLSGKEQHLCPLLLSILRSDLDTFLDVSSSRYIKYIEPPSINNKVEYDVFLLQQAMENKDGGALGVIFSVYPQWQNTLNALREKWGQYRFGKYEGIICPNTFTQQLDLLSPTKIPEISPKFIEKYACCPYQFFLDKALQLKPQPEKSLFQITDNDRKKILLAVIQKYKNMPQSDLHVLLENSANRYLQDKNIKQSFILRVEKMRLLYTIKNYVHKFIGSESVDSYFAVSYSGNEINIRIDNDRKIHFYGMLDQVDTNQQGSYSIQYKLGKTSQTKNNCLYGGQQIQLAIELAALQKCMRDSSAKQSEYRYIQENGDYKQVHFSIEENTLDSVQKICHFVCSGIENGFFMPMPEEQKCRRCEFSQICGPYRYILHRLKQEDPHIDFFRLLSSIGRDALDK